MENRRMVPGEFFINPLIYIHLFPFNKAQGEG